MLLNGMKGSCPNSLRRQLFDSRLARMSKEGVPITPTPDQNLPVLSYDHEAIFGQPRTQSWMEKTYLRVRDWRESDNWPTLLEAHWKVGVAAALAVSAAAVGVGIVDQVFDLHLGKDMASARVEPHDNWLERHMQEAIHDIGVQAAQAEQG